MLVTGSFRPMRCGVGDYTRRLAGALAARGDLEVAVLTSKSGEGEPPIGVQRFAIVDHWSLGAAKTVWRLLRSWRPAVVHLQYPTQGYGSGRLPHFLPLLAWASGARVVRTLHEVTTWDRLASVKQVVTFALQALAPGTLIVVRPSYRSMLHPLLAWMTRPRRYVFVPSAASLPRSSLHGDSWERVRSSYLGGKQRLIVFFGFLYPPKGADLLFEIADPATDRLIFAGATGSNDGYVRKIRELAASERWRGRAEVAGYLPDEDAADLLTVADAAVLPFRDGGGPWNTSILAAIEQETPVITTALDGPREDSERGIYFARPGNIEEMKKALDRLASPSARRPPVIARSDPWSEVAARHVAIYRGGRRK
ncbi:glycosyltransferase family 4 protein [Sphingomonas lutea]|uniref:Glycosyltransferase family 4 protein n=2 Tax=Sphingomonas lutea TaxID=1045317 RepID=A0A7G9SEW3_9SPHN|nr:glycosyltransferase family 4 protein [Sphingomonas lutea]